MVLKHTKAVKLSHLAISTLALVMLAACGDGVPKATDEQLLKLVGDQETFWGKTKPLSISKRTVECVRALSGVDDAIYKDMPAELLGTYKTECRKKLTERVADKEKNPLGFTLKSFDSQELAKRITELKTSTDESNRIAEEKEEERINAEKSAKMQAELDAERRQYQAFVDSIDERVKKVAPRCQAWHESQRAVKAKEKYSHWVYSTPPQICNEKNILEIRQNAKKNLEHLANEKIKPDSLFGKGFSTPYYGNASATWFDEQSTELEEEIEQMKAVVSEKSQ